MRGPALRTTAITKRSIYVKTGEIPLETTAKLTNQSRLLDAYRWLIVAAGGLALVWCSSWLPAPRFDWRFLVLAAVMMMVSARFAVPIPRVNTNVTISDSFIFLVLLLYGGVAGMMLAAL